MERIKGKKSISRIFAFYTISFCAAAVILIAANFFLFVVMLRSGSIRPANYYEKYIEQRRNAIEEAKDVKTIIPKECSYAVFSSDGKFVEGNVTENKALTMWKIFKNDEKIDGDNFYKIIQRKNEVCIIEYKLIAQFSNHVLQKFISAERYFELQYVILFICAVILFSKSFRKRMLKEMKILKETTENIQMENLDFEIKSSNIIEINEVLSALDKMKAELQYSLNKQWKMEEMRKEQMAALAHDIKTPLTILRGNAELLEELKLDSEQEALIKDIINESAKMETYIKSLIEIMKSGKGVTLHKKEVNSQSFIESICEAGTSMARGKEIKFIKKAGEVPEVFLADEEALRRAIINVISNAVDYSPFNGEILFNVDEHNGNLRFVVEDSGRGFSSEEINCAAEQFFQGDKSRNSKNHYGMGLYIAKEFITQHNGTIVLGNSEKIGGAKVTLEIPGRRDRFNVPSFPIICRSD